MVCCLLEAAWKKALNVYSGDSGEVQNTEMVCTLGGRQVRVKLQKRKSKNRVDARNVRQ